MKEAQRQLAESNKRLQRVEGELMVVKKKLEEERDKLQQVEGERSHMDQQLRLYLSDFEVERQAREKDIDNLTKKLAEAKKVTLELRQQMNQQADIIQRVCCF